MFEEKIHSDICLNASEEHGITLSHKIISLEKGEQVWALTYYNNGEHQILLTPTTDIEEKRKPWWKNSLNKVNLFNFPKYCKT